MSCEKLLSVILMRITTVMMIDGGDAAIILHMIRCQETPQLVSFVSGNLLVAASSFLDIRKGVLAWIAWRPEDKGSVP